MALLSTFQVSAVLASNGREAVRLAAEQEFDIILMDLDMPVVDGFSATKLIRRQERASSRRLRVPIVAYTASDCAKSDKRWPRSEIDAVLVKPSDAGALAECLRRWCSTPLP